MTLATKANAKIAIKTFDYGGIDPKHKSRLIYLAAEVHKATNNHVGAAIELGRALAKAQEIFAVAGRKGRFGEWIDKECGFSRSSAYRYIEAFARFDGRLEDVGQFTLGAIFALAPEKVPQLAVDEALKAAKKGVRINSDRANEFLEKFRAVKKPKTSANPGIKSSHTWDDSPTEDGECTPEDEGGEAEFDTVAIEAQPKATVDIAGLSAPYKQSVLEIGAIITRLKKLAEEERTGAHLVTKIARITHDLTDAKTAISEAEPVRVCPKCDGAGCHPCAHTGFWTRTIMKSFK